MAIVDRPGALRSCWRPLGRRAARAYVAGPRLTDAVGASVRAGGRGLACAIGFWDGGEAPRAVADRYLDALDAIAAAGLDGYVSIKAPALGFSTELVREVLDRSARRGVGLHFDALGPASVEPTLALIDGALPHAPGLGCTLPARWRRSMGDADRVVAQGLRARLVKGEEPGPDGDDVDPREGMLALADRLAGRARHVAVATHDARLARAVLERLATRGTHAELELLFGLPLGRPMRVARRAGVRVRLYVPYGHARLPYRLSEAGTRPAVLWWLARDLVQDGIRTLTRGGSVAEEV